MLRSQLASEFILWYYYGMKIALSIPDELFDSAESLSMSSEPAIDDVMALKSISGRQVNEPEMMAVYIA